MPLHNTPWYRAAVPGIREIYQATKKKQDINWFTANIARPPAAAVVWAVAGTRMTPNQLTFLSAVVCAVAGVGFALAESRWWLLGAAVLFELSFVLDCADGMLARWRKIASPLGHLLDFLMDEIKAMWILAAVTIYVWRDTQATWVLLVGLGALFSLASGIALTSFMRRPEYGAAPWTQDGQPAQVGGRRGMVGGVLSLLEWGARILVHYPQYIWICAALGRMDWFLWLYGGVSALYLAKAFATIAWRLGRFTEVR